MNDPEAERQIRHEQRCLWGGNAVIAATVVGGIALLAAGIAIGYVVVAIVPTSALGALLIFDARNRAGNRDGNRELFDRISGEFTHVLEQIGHRLDEHEVRLEKLESGRIEIEQENGSIARTLFAFLGRLDFTDGEIAAPRQGIRTDRGQLPKSVPGRRTGGRPHGRGRMKQARKPIDEIVAEHPNVIDIEDARILKRIERRLKDRGFGDGLGE